MSATPRVLVVDDEPDILTLLEVALGRMGLEVERALGVQDALKLLGEKKFNLCLTDMRMADGDGLMVLRHIVERELDTPVAVFTAHGNLDNAVAALKAGAFDYLSKPVSLDQLRALVTEALRLPSARLSTSSAGATLLGKSSAMQEVRELIKRVARSHAPVHISGESGSGKELAARMLVAQSARREQVFVPVNCGAIPENLMESEFFGYRKGAFTGADKDKAGFFQAAHQGTLLLDEVADLPLAMQVKLLRAIQEKKVRRVGATEEEAVDVRIISSTHRDLAKCVQEGKFRQDLYYRLNVIAIHLPALREMREDIPTIAQHVLERLRGTGKAYFSQASLQALATYEFPGNVRELENVIERALALCVDDVIQPADLQLAPVSMEMETGKGAAGGKYPLTDYLDRIEREVIVEALGKTHFNRTAAAKILGVTFRALRYRMERLSITEQDETK
ncbi:MAG: sigma-54-dependent Fis family transcriptional regulator [Sideroxydans sp.]|nr:sigma-54-dependent Fis family transcriptional regulator [Sideroxydans sp.]